LAKPFINKKFEGKRGHLSSEIDLLKN